MGSGLRWRRHIREQCVHGKLGLRGRWHLFGTSTFFTQFNFTLRLFGATLQSSTLYALHTGDVLIVPPATTSDTVPTFMAVPQRPNYSQTLNWIFVQWDSSADTLKNTYLSGTTTYSSSKWNHVISQYDVTGQAYWLGSNPMNSAGCDTNPSTAPMGI